MITCDAVSVSLYRNTGVSLSRHAVTHDFAGALGPGPSAFRANHVTRGPDSAKLIVCTT